MENYNLTTEQCQESLDGTLKAVMAFAILQEVATLFDIAPWTLV